MPHKKAKRSVREQESIIRGNDLAPTSTTTHTSKKRKSASKSHSLDTEPLPKSLSRVLNAASIQSEWKRKRVDDEDDIDRVGGNEDSGVKKKRRLDDASEATKKNKEKELKKKKALKEEKEKKMKIQPGETLGHFNRRVEDDMRTVVKSAMQTSRATVRAVQKAEIDGKVAAKAAKAAKNKPPPTSEDEGEDIKTPSVQKQPVDKHASSAKEFQVHSSRAPKRLNDIAQAPPEFTSLPRGVGKNAASIAQFGGSTKTTEGDSAFAGVLSMAQKLMMATEREGAIRRYREMKAAKRGGVTDERDRDGVDGEEVD